MKPPRLPQCAPPETFPEEIVNRPSLGRIAYRIGAYQDARRFLLRRLDEDAQLSGWTYRGADDPGIALYESAAEVVDLLTFYQEVYANEAFLRTAAWRESVADLVRLTGYRLKPGIGGTGLFAFEVTGTDPVALPPGLPITADLADDPATASFETSEAATALPWLSRFTLVRPQLDRWMAIGLTHLLVKDPSLTFAKNDRLLVGVPSAGTSASPLALDPWEIVVVASVDTWHGRALLTLKGPITKTGGFRFGLAAYKLGDTFHHFGRNAPKQYVTVDDTGKASATWPNFWRSFTETVNGDAGLPDPVLNPKDLILDPQDDQLALGAQLAIEITTWEFPTLQPLQRVQPLPTLQPLKSGTEIAELDMVRIQLVPRQHVYLRRISDLRPVTARYGSLTGAATLASIDSGIDAAQVKLGDIQVETIQGAMFQVGAPWADEPLAQGPRLAWWGDSDQAQSLRGRTIAFVPAVGDAYTATVVDVVQEPTADLSIVVLDRDVPYSDFSSATPTTAVLGNLVAANEGKAQDQTVLGNGDDQQTFQTFQLPTDPLTYLDHPNLTPPARPEITIVVGNRIWQYVPTLYGQTADAEVYVVLQDNGGTSWVQFGDGKTGARLPSGVGNVRVQWRTGSAAFGPMKPGASPSLAQRIDAVKTLDLPTPIEGGAAPETADVARTAAPARVQSLDRLVSLADIEAEALALGGVDRARAAWAIVDDLPRVQVTVLMQAKRKADLANVQASLATANRMRGPDRFPIQVIAGAFEYVYLDLSVAIDPTYDEAPLRAAIEAALGVTGLETSGVDGTKGLFGELGPHDIGDAEYATRIEATAQNVDGVLWAVVNRFGSLGTPDDPSTLTFPRWWSARHDTVPCASTHMLRLYHGGDGGPLILRTAPGGSR